MAHIVEKSTSDWSGRVPESRCEKKPKRGDMIEIFRGRYQHWAVYIGHGYVVHVSTNSNNSTSFNSLMSAPNEMAVVKKEKLLDVVGNNKWTTNNSLDKKHCPRDIRVIVREAHARVGDRMRYNVLTENCEHFATNLRYGKPESQQVLDWVERCKKFIFKVLDHLFRARMNK